MGSPKWHYPVMLEHVFIHLSKIYEQLELSGNNSSRTGD
jgi:hypothetical protein